MADITCTSFDDLYDPENDEVDETRPDIRKNLLEDFAAPTAKLTRESVAHSREHMQVHLRIRPFTNREKEQGESQDCMEISQPTSLLMRAPKDSFTFKSSQRGFSNMTHKFTFSRIFGEDTSQKEFFDETMLGTVKDFIDGQNCLVFTYGVTNAGKTYTIQGVPQDGGILPRSLDVIFNSLEGRLFPSLQLKPRFFCDVAKLDERQRKKEEYIKDSVLSMAEGNSNKQEGTQDSSGMDEADDSRASSYTTATEDSQSEISVSSITDDASMPNVLDDINSRIPDDTSVDVEAQGPLKFSVWVSFAEVYNEYIYDLLEAIPKAKKVRRQPLKFSEDKNGQIYIKGLKEISVQSADEAYKILKIGQQNLSMAATKLNHCSSRSHCIFSIKILRVVDVENPHVARVSQLSFCDLAGSERYTRTQNTGDRLKEAGNINTSLLTLGKCIHTLRYNQNHPKSNPKIIPFRESKLTRLFQSFFMGKGKASMVVNVNQCASGFDETLQVLKFSAIAKQVTTVTSKLDNKWKVPAAGGPKLASSRALSLALRQSLSRNRASVAWATPGPQLDSNLDLTTVDESFEEDEDDEEDDEEEEDGERTPRESMVNEESRAALINLVEMLKTQLIEEKKRMMMLEVQIREEVCQEMAQQLVQIEGDYKDQLEKERLTTEEMFEKRLEMYEKSVKTTRKRPRPDDEEEYVSSLLLHAEQTKVQNQEKINEGLRQDIETLKEALEESHEKMSSQDETLTELQRLTEESKQALREAEAKLCAKDEKLDALLHKIQELEDIHKDSRQKLEQETSDKEKVAAEYERSLALKSHAIEELEDTNEELEDANRRLQQQLGLTEKLQTQLSQSESTLKDTYQVIQTLEQDIDKLKRQLEDSENELSESKVHPVDCPDKLHAEKLQKKVTALEKEIQEQVASKEETLDKWREEKDNLVNALEQMEHRMTSLLETQKNNEAVLAEKDQQNEHLETQLSQSESNLKDSNLIIEALEQDNDKLRSQLEDSHKQNEAALADQNEVSDLKAQLSESESTLKDSNQVIKTLEQDIEKLRSQLEDSQNELIESKNHRVDCPDKLQAKKLQEKVTALEKEIKMQVASKAETLSNWHEEKDSLVNTLEQMEHRMTSLLETQKKSESASSEKDERIQHLETQLSQSESSLKDSNQVIRTLGQNVDKLRSQLEESQKQNEAAFDEKVKRIEDLETQLSQSKSSLKDSNQFIKTLEQDIEKLIGRLEDSQKQNEEVLTDKDERIKDLETQLSQSKSSLKDSNQVIKRHEQDIDKLRNQLEDSQRQKETAFTDRNGRIEHLETQLSESESTLRDSNQLIKTLEQDIDKLRSRLEDSQRQNEAALADKNEVLKDIKMQLCDSKSNLKDSNQVIKTLEQDIDKLRSQLENSQKQNEAALAEKDERIKDLEMQLSQSKSTLKDSNQVIKTLEQDIDKLRSQLEDSQEQLSESKRHPADCPDKLQAEKLQKKVTTLEKEIKELVDSKEETLARWREEHDSLVMALDTRVTSLFETQTENEAALSEKDESIQHLKTQLSQSESTLRDTNQAIKILEQDIDKLRSQLEDSQKQNKAALADKDEHVEDLEARLSQSESTLKDSNQVIKTLEQDIDKLRSQLENSQKQLIESKNHPVDCPDKLQAEKLQKKVTALEKEVMKQVASKEETLNKWREDRDSLVKALEQRMTSLLETQEKNEAALAEKDAHIEQLKTKMIENISDSQSVTDDESYIEDTSSTKTKGRSRKGRGQTSNVQGELQREVQQLREQMEKERNAKEKVVAESKRNLVLKSHAIQELEDANRHLQQQLGLIEVTVDVKRLSRSSSESSTTTRQSAPSSSPQPDPDSPDLFIVDVKDQESFHQPGRRRTRVELDLTPLQKKQPARKTRANTRKARKRKSTELLEEIDMDAYQKRSRPEEQSAARPVRSTRKRNTRANRGETDLDQDENTLAAETPSASNRGKRAALSRIGDLLQNTQFAKSAKKLVESAAAHMTSPTKSPEVQEVAYYPPPTTEKKRKRRLLKTDISVPFESSPFEVLNAGESKSDNSHSIVTRKLRSRNTRV
ncbi:kinesin-like protein KIF20B isoform X2 [Patiria miniata]|uniref:Kinesin motor domain-containing protein n=1 Tax=Patiria miniata TaxID=46514 RepID=A0A914B5B5_PATMI|nr:kinesin-like protein KIF20B isoform X2 [Patiria miniata]